MIVVPVELSGPSGAGIVRLALDTGATSTLINSAILVALGYEPSLSTKMTQVTTGSGVEYVPQIITKRIRALGVTKTRFEILAHTLPPSANVDAYLA